MVNASEEKLHKAYYFFDSIIHPSMIWVKINNRRTCLHTVLVKHDALSKIVRFNKQSRTMTQRFAQLSRGTGNTSLIKTITSRNRVVRNSGAVFDTIPMPSNVRRLGENTLLHLVAMHNLNFDIYQDLFCNYTNFANGEKCKLPDNLDFDQRITILGFGRENLPKMAKDWLGQQGKT